MNRQIFAPEHDVFRETVRTFLAKEVLPHYEQWEKDGIVSREAWRAAGRRGAARPRGPRGVRRRRQRRLPLQRRTGGGVHPGRGQRPRPRPPQRHRRPLPHPALHPRAEAALAAGLLLRRDRHRHRHDRTGCLPDLQGIRTTAEDRGDHWLLNGSKTFISNGILADLVVVVARTAPEGGAKGLSLLVVERGAAGFERGRNLEKIGQKSQDTAELFFHDVRVPKENLLGELHGGFLHLMTNLAQERMGIAVAGIAAAEHLLEITTRYVKEREAFGRPLSKLQHVRFEIAEMATECAVTRTFLDRCIVEHADGTLDAVHASMAKWWATELQKRVADRCLQLHGGYGYMAEFPVARAYTDGRIQTIYGGTTEIMKEIIGRSLLS